MKKYLKILILCLTFGLLTTGCLSYKTTMKINDDKSMDFNMYLSLDLKTMTSMMDSLNEDNEEEYLNCLEENDGDEDNCIEPAESDFDMTSSLNEEQFKNFEKRGYKVEENNSKNKFEVNISKTFSNIDDLVTTDSNFAFNLNDFTNDDFEEKFFTVKKGFLEDTYELKINYSSEEEEAENNLGIDLNSISSLLDVKYEVSLPKESVSNNATSISSDKKTLTWELNPSDNKNIDVVFTMPSANKNLIIYGGIGIGVVLLLIILLIVISKKKGKNKKAPVNNEAPNPAPVNNPNVAPTPVNEANAPISPASVIEPIPMATFPAVEETTSISPLPVVEQPVAPAPTEQVSNPIPVAPTLEPQVAPPVEPVPTEQVINPAPVAPTLEPQVAPPVEPAPTESVINPAPVAPTLEPQVAPPIEPAPIEGESSPEDITSDLKNIAMDILNKHNE